MEGLAICLLLIIVACLEIYLIFKRSKVIVNVDTQELDTKLNSLAVRVSDLGKQGEALPKKVTQSITGSTNQIKGSVGEYISYLKLASVYDRFIPVGNIADFIGIKFPDEFQNGRIDFVEIKTGKTARLSGDQKLLKEVLLHGNIELKVVKLTTDTLVDRSLSDDT